MYDVEIKLLDKASEFMWPDERAAWQTLKAAVLAQQTNNKQSTPCPDCDKVHGKYTMCDNCMFAHPYLWK